MTISRTRLFFQVQLFGWIAYCIIAYLFNAEANGKHVALQMTLVSVGVYALVIYGNSFLLMPLLYQKGKWMAYLLLAFSAVAVLGFLRVWLNQRIVENYLQQDLPVRTPVIYVGILYILVVFFIGFILFHALNYFKLFEQQERIRTRQAEAELKLLKAKVQPHFLYNTLNTIYSVAYEQSPETARLIERLSFIMRYFTDEATRETVPASCEIELLKSYMDLENARMRYPVKTTFQVEPGIASLQLPPMLLIPLVENVFKHGLNRRLPHNFIDVGLTMGQERLVFRVANSWHQSATRQSGGTGLANLRARLALLYGGNYQLDINKTPTAFIATLHIPVV